jgi:hypothetical protein
MFIDAYYWDTLWPVSPDWFTPDRNKYKVEVLYSNGKRGIKNIYEDEIKQIQKMEMAQAEDNRRASEAQERIIQAEYIPQFPEDMKHFIQPENWPIEDWEIRNGGEAFVKMYGPFEEIDGKLYCRGGGPKNET